MIKNDFVDVEPQQIQIKRPPLTKKDLENYDFVLPSACFKRKYKSICKL